MGVHNERAGIAEALAAVFTPAARAFRYVAFGKLLFAPFRGPTGFTARMGIPFDFEKCLPRGAARVAQPDPCKMEIFVEQHAPVLSGMPLQLGIENSLPPAN